MKGLKYFLIGSVLLTIILMNFIAAIHEDFPEADFHCLVVDKTECTEEDEHIVMRLNETENSHGEVNESDNYDKVVCCASSAVFSLFLAHAKSGSGTATGGSFTGSTRTLTVAVSVRAGVALSVMV